MIVYQDEQYTLSQNGSAPLFTTGGRTYSLSCNPHEPCMYIESPDSAAIYIHNAFDPDYALNSFANGKTVTSITGKVYTALDFCEALEYAVQNCLGTDIGYIEGALSVRRLIELGAQTPETAVSLKYIGVKSISDRFSHSKKLTERVMYTDEGKAYVRIKK